MTDVQIAFGFGLLAGMFLIALALFVSEVRNAPVVETMSPHTYQAIVEITAERSRQVVEEGFTADRDDQYTRGELSRAALSYADFAASLISSRFDTNFSTPPAAWPWAIKWWKVDSPRRCLIKAAALIVAEVERLDRASERQGGAT